jgi:hypothetical protein
MSLPSFLRCIWRAIADKGANAKLRLICVVVFDSDGSRVVLLRGATENALQTDEYRLAIFLPTSIRALQSYILISGAHINSISFSVSRVASRYLVFQTTVFLE